MTNVDISKDLQSKVIFYSYKEPIAPSPYICHIFRYKAQLQRDSCVVLRITEIKSEN
jgi:hypothetical protein